MSNQTIDELLADAREVYAVFGKAQRALNTVDRVLEMQPDSVEALNLKAAILYDLDKDEEAIEYHEKALAVEPCSVEALHGLAALANERGDYSAALEWAERGFACITKDPSSEMRENEDYRQQLIAELYSEKAFSLWYQGKRDEVMRLLTTEGPDAVPLEVELFEEQLEWLQAHPNSPEEEA
ncbi:MAG: tetratricopeptide repeat protein [Armatimonadota bacterium]